LPERASWRHCANESNAQAHTPLTSCTTMHHGCGGRAALALDAANDASPARSTIKYLPIDISATFVPVARMEA
jgi:hypothetical protein